MFHNNLSWSYVSCVLKIPYKYEVSTDLSSLFAYYSVWTFEFIVTYWANMKLVAVLVAVVFVVGVTSSSIHPRRSENQDSGTKLEETVEGVDNSKLSLTNWWLKPKKIIFVVLNLGLITILIKADKWSVGQKQFCQFCCKFKFSIFLWSKINIFLLFFSSGRKMTYPYQNCPQCKCW